MEAGRNGCLDRVPMLCMPLPFSFLTFSHAEMTAGASHTNSTEGVAQSPLLRASELGKTVCGSSTPFCYVLQG